jgi:hypothetical protein
MKITKKDTTNTGSKHIAKEDLKVTHENGNIYIITLDNGNPPEDDISTIKIGVDEDGYLEINRNFTTRKFGIGFPPYNRIEHIKDVQNLTDYQNCRGNAVDSTNIFHSS